MERRKVKFRHIAAVLLCGLRAKIDGIRAAGDPVTFAELDAWYKIPTFTENAAGYITDAFACLRLPEGEEREPLVLFGSAKLPPRTQPLDEQAQALVGTVLADNETALKLLHAGASIPHCRYPIDLGEGHAVLTPHIAHFRNAVRLLSLKAIWHTERNELAEAVDALVSALGIARSLVQEPLIMSQLVRQGCQSLTVSTFELIINRTPFADQQLIELERALSVAYDPNALARAFVGERCGGLALFRDPQMTVGMFPTQGGLARVVVGLLRAIGLLDIGQATYIDVMAENIQAAQLPPHERHAAAKAIERKLAQMHKAHAWLREFMPALNRTIELDVADMARILTTRAAVAVERYRLAAGQLPGQLDDLVPRYLDRVPQDPFDGRPLRYTKLEKGYVIYSVGTDGEDNGGKEKPPRRRGSEQSPNYDITFIVER
jgi:hypothetical protein